MKNVELQKYIESRRKDGASNMLITDELLQAGWDVAVVEEAFADKSSSFWPTLRHIAPTFLLVAGITLVAFSSGLALRGVFSAQNNDIPLPEIERTRLLPGETLSLSNVAFYENTKQGFIESKSDLVEADLSAMLLRVYKAGEQVLEVPIMTKGREGSWWETPAGLYSIQSKKESHFSSFGQVNQPWSMAFQGNFFIHGWPTYPSGEAVPPGYSGGCIRLSTEDAKKVYDLVNVDTPVLVFEKDFSADAFTYSGFNVSISSDHYLAADLSNNFVFYAKNSTTALPIASITKLMTALVATEYLNLDTVTKVPKEAIVYTSVPRLRAGQEISIYQLLFPLLTESSNEAAEAIARQYDREQFIAKMNEKAKSIGMTSTLFTDPSGLAATNASTPEDLFMLAKYIYNNRSFVFYITSGKLTASAYGAPTYTDLSNFNDLHEHKLFFGGKVGQTLAAGNTSISVFNVPIGTTTRPVAIVVLKAEDSEQDMQILLDSIVKKFSK